MSRVKNQSHKTSILLGIPHSCNSFTISINCAGWPLWTSLALLERRISHIAASYGGLYAPLPDEKNALHSTASHSYLKFRYGALLWHHPWYRLIVCSILQMSEGGNRKGSVFINVHISHKPCNSTRQKGKQHFVWKYHLKFRYRYSTVECYIIYCRRSTPQIYLSR